MSVPSVTHSIAFVVNAHMFDLDAFTTTCGIAPTHWHDKVTFHPEEFGVAFHNADKEDRYTWQLRMECTSDGMLDGMMRDFSEHLRPLHKVLLEACSAQLVIPQIIITCETCDAQNFVIDVPFMLSELVVLLRARLSVNIWQV